MRKIYFFLLSMVFSTVLFAQDCLDDVEPPVLSCPSDTVVDMDEGGLGAFVNITGITRQAKVCLVYADYDSYAQDVQAKLMATGNFSVVDLSNISSRTPTLPGLIIYDAILVWRSPQFSDTTGLGNVLAAYVNAGKGLVMAARATSNVYPSGAFETDQYAAIVPGSLRTSPQAFLGNVYLPGHPLMNGITSFDGGPNSYRSGTNNLTTGSYRVADWTGGIPLIAAKENVGPANARRVDINFYPPTLTTYGNSAWDVNTDGDLIMANALTWVAGAAIAYDNCKLVEVTNDFNNSSSLSDLYPEGTTLVTVTATDETMNSSTCSFSVTVNSPEPPVAVCKNITVELDENGQVTIEAADVDGGSTVTVYPIDTLTIDVETFDCSMIGENSVVLTVTDENGNSSTCTTVVTVEDNTAPVIDCPEDIVVDNDPGENGAVVNFGLNKITFTGSFIQNETYSLCNQWEEFQSNLLPILPYTKLTIKGSNDPIGVSITDPVMVQQLAEALHNGNSISVNDGDRNWRTGICGGGMELSAAGSICDCPNNEYIVRPCIENMNWGGVGTATCNGPSQTIIVEFEYFGEGEEHFAIDNCDVEPQVVQTAGLPSGSLFPIGTTINSFVVTDASGNSANCIFAVTVEDNEAPVAVCIGSGETGKAAYVISTAGQPWGQSTNEQAMDMAFGSGNWDQLYYETLDVNNLLSSNYDFIFMEGGDFIANEMETFVDANISAMETWVADGGNLFLNAAPNEGDGMDWGFWGVQLQYGDDSSSGQVEPTDLNHPIFSGPFTPLALYYTGSSFAHAIIPEELNVKVLINDFSNPEKHVLTEIEWGTGKVFFGGMTTTNFHDPNPEAINLRANMLSYLGTKSSMEFMLDDTGNLTLTPEDIDGGSYDNQGIESMEINPSEFDESHVGEQEITLIVTDHSGNADTCISTITIVSGVDNEAPVVVANPLEVVLDETGRYVLNQNDLEAIAAGTTDNKTPFEELKLVAYPKIFVCDNVGEIIHVRLTVEDVDGNRSRQWTTVTVLDTIAPVALCQNIEVYLDENGQAVITPEQVMDPASSDACGIDSVFVDQAVFNCTNLGANSVTLSISDISGNVGTCTAIVTVIDTLQPAPVVVSDLAVELAPGVCETTIEYPEELVSDNCNVTLMQTAGLGPDGIFPLGTTTETWVATDDAGNTAEITFNVVITTTNALPTLDAVTDITADEDTPTLTVELTGISFGIDCEEQKVTVTAVSDNAELVSVVEVEYTEGETTGSVMLTMASDMNGTSEITVTVEDIQGAMFSQTFTVTVTSVNDAPFVVNAIPDQVVNASYVLKIPLSPELGIVFDDVDDDMLAFGIMEEGGGALPGWATIVGDTLVCTPMIADTGCVTLVLKAMDAAGASATDTFIVCVDGYPVSSPLVNESAFDVKMYPNPTKDIVYIDVNDTGGVNDVSVYSITGNEILRRNFYNNQNISFNMSDYASGIYLVKINVEGKQIVKKLVLDKK